MAKLLSFVKPHGGMAEQFHSALARVRAARYQHLPPLADATNLPSCASSSGNHLNVSHWWLIQGAGDLMPRLLDYLLVASTDQPLTTW